MSSTAARLRSFASAALVRAGAVVEWPEDDPAGELLLPESLARTLGCGEHVRLATAGVEGDLRLDLAGDVLERLQALAETGPWVAAARSADRAAKKLDAAALVDRSIDVANARVRLVNAAAVQLEYHLWQVAIQLSGEESWEDVIAVAVNAVSGRQVSLERLPEDDLVAWHPTQLPSDTAVAAQFAAAALAESRAAAFVARLAARRQRDRKRLRDYYGALLTPSRRSPRGAHLPTLKEIDARQAAVDQELARKLDEVDERSRLRCRIQSVGLLRLELPAWAIDVSIQRRTAVRTVRTWWNHRSGGLDPLACEACGAVGLRFLARDQDAALLCPSCSG